MRVEVKKATLVFRDVSVEGQLKAEEVRLESNGASLLFGPETALRAEGTRIRIVISEVAANQAISSTPVDGIRDLKLAFLTGKLRIEGRYGIVGPLAVPFALTGTLEADRGVSLRFLPTELNVVGASLGAVAQTVGERVNARLRERLDLSKLPFSSRLESVACEPGRLILEAAADIEIRRTAAAIAPKA